MTEFKAHLMVFAAAAVLTVGVYIALAAVHASGTAIGAALVLIVALAADTSARIVIHYGSSKRRGR